MYIWPKSRFLVHFGQIEDGAFAIRALYGAGPHSGYGNAFLKTVLILTNSIVAHSPYSKFEAGELILRDELAIDRTILANERTLLAYLRSGVSLIIAGVSIMHFAQTGWFSAVGLACIPVGLVTAIFGVFRFRQINKSISTVRKQLPRLGEQD